MAIRDLLHISKLEAFKQFLARNNIQFRDGKGEFQVLQVFINSKWSPIYRRNDMPEHFTIQAELKKIVRKFIAE